MCVIFHSRFRWNDVSWLIMKKSTQHNLNLDGLSGVIEELNYLFHCTVLFYTSLSYSHLCYTNVETTSPILACSNSARKKANSTRALIICAHHIGFARYTDKVLTRQMYQVPRWLFMETLGIWKPLPDIHIHKPLSYSLPDIVLFLL